MNDATHATRTPHRARLALLALLTASLPAAAVDIANTPLFLPTPLAPNVVLTLDDSGSMRFAYAQEVDAAGFPLLNKKRSKSAHFNPYYYDPGKTYPPAKDATGADLTTSFNQAYINGFDPSRGTLDLGGQFRPTAEYNPSSANAAGNPCNTGQDFAPHFEGAASADFPNQANDACVAAYYYKFDTTKANSNNMPCDAASTVDRDDEACYTKVVVGDAEKQNFANWYSFYRTRNLLTVTAASRAFVGMTDKIRLSWQAINTCTAFDDNCKGWSNAAGDTVDNQLLSYQGGHKANFYKWLFRLPAAGETPLRGAMQRAGEYFKGARVYRTSPADADSPVHACRDNFHVLMTDGGWNADANLVGPGNADSTAVNLPDGVNYTARPPFQDTNTDSLADIAFHYWATDLINLPNNLLPYTPDKADPGYWNPRNDPATWQHMVNFTVGLGLTSELGDDWDTANNKIKDNVYDAFRSGARTWPATGPNVLPGNVYDLWHAALNSRGEFFSAARPGDVQAAFDDILQRIDEKDSAAAALATNSSRLDTGTLLYQATFNSRDWHGTLVGRDANDPPDFPVVWTASIPATRHLYTWSGAPSTFAWAALTNDQRTAIGGEAIFNYLAGDQSQEQRNGGGFRNRSGLLGDIINSNPVFAGSEDFGYARLAEGLDTAADPYKTFLAGKANRTKMLYVGANDGMLHAFRADTGQADSGQERFAYVPNAVIPNLALLSDPAYTHRYYVDGSPFVGDAHLDDGDAGTDDWRTILLGTTGAGGRVVFALDVTDPDNFGVNDVMWEFTHAELGYTIGRPIIARLNNGRWAAVFGNGYNSDSGNARLFIVYLDADLSDGQWNPGTDYLAIQLGNQADNGLASPVLYDANGDMVTDAIYAGDMRGNVWKIDVSGNDPLNWGVAFAGNPLFSARDANNAEQPITAPLEIGAPPPGLSGAMIYFGTGRFFATGDKVDLGVQSLYGIHDNGATPASDFAAPNRNALQSQAIIYQGTLSGTAVRATTNNAVDYANQDPALAKRGWYMDLVPPGGAAVQGERVVSAPLLRHGRVIYTTLIPSSDPCAFGGSSWIMEFAAVSGGANEAVFDVDDNSIWDTVTFRLGNSEVTVPVSGVNLGVGISGGPTVLADATGATERKFVGGATTAIGVVGELGGGGATGRVSWREIID